MTNQNAIASGVKSTSIDMLHAVAVTVPVHPQEALTMIAYILHMPKMKFKKRLEYGGAKGGAKVKTWIDSMRASSPTRVKSNLSVPENQEKRRWNFHHPSALEMFDQLTHKSEGKQIVVFLDYDGTLSPIVNDPDKAFMAPEMRETVKDIARHFPTAIVSGRSTNKVYDFVNLAELYYAGSHGMDIMGPTKTSKKENQAVLFQPAGQFLPMINEVYKILVEKTKSVPGAKVENNKFCLSVHFRCVDEKSWDALGDQVRLVLKDYPKLKLTQGRKVLEIRPSIKWNKGNALEFLLQSLGFANSDNVFPIYIGDDRTDEDAFKVLTSRGQGAGILVSRVVKETDASYTLQDPCEVEQFLRRLVEWRAESLQEQ